MDSQPRICPHCKIEIPIDHGFYFDKDLNLIHAGCNKIVFSTTTTGDCQVSMIRYQTHYPPPSLGFDARSARGANYDMEV